MATAETSVRAEPDSLTAIDGLLSFWSCVMITTAWLLLHSGVGAGIGGAKDRVPLLRSPSLNSLCP